MAQTLYQLLDVSENADFSELKRAYFRQAKQCHPDRFRNSPDKTRQFQELVHAFDVLSDAERRHEYDLSIGMTNAADGAAALFAAGGPLIMDFEADEILEELVVGNDPPLDSSLATLLADLAGTEVFLLYREARDHESRRRFVAAEHCYREVVRRAPQNIVFRVRYARVLCRRGRYSAAMSHYRAAMRIGRFRRPPLLLRRVQREWEAAMRRHQPVRYWFRHIFSKPQESFIADPADEMIAAFNRAAARELARVERKYLTGDEDSSR